MPDGAVVLDAVAELKLAEQQAAELWAQSERLTDAYRAVARRADDLRLRLPQLEVGDKLRLSEPVGVGRGSR